MEAQVKWGITTLLYVGARDLGPYIDVIGHDEG